MSKLNWIICVSQDRGTDYGVGTFVKQLSIGLSRLDLVDVFVLDIGDKRQKKFELLIENKSIKENDYKKNRQTEILKKILLPVGIWAVILFTAYNLMFEVNLKGVSNYVFCGLILSKLVGITASIFLILHEGMKSSYSEMLKFVQEMDGTAEIVTLNTRAIFRFIEPLRLLFE